MGRARHARRRARHQRCLGRVSVLAWGSIKRHAELAGSFASTCFSHLPNPFTEAISHRAQARMHQLVLLVIAVFILVYLGLALIRLS